jgi:hypothetical protein
MTEIAIPTEILGDPEYDEQKETLTFYGSSAVLISRILSEAREKRERTEREERLSSLVRANAKRYSHREVSASSLHTAFQDFADRALEIFEVPR